MEQVNKITDKKVKNYAKRILNLLRDCNDGVFEKYEDVWLTEMQDIYQKYGKEGMKDICDEIRGMIDKVLEENLGVCIKMLKAISETVSLIQKLDDQNIDIEREDRDFIKALPFPL